MIKLKATFFSLALFFLASSSTNAQGMLNRIKQKAAAAAERAIDRKVDDKINEAVGNPTDNSSSENGTSGSSTAGNSSNSKNRPTNKGGAGLVTTPPDVKGNLATAESSFKAGTYGEARYALQQAMLGVEMEIGQKLLKGLPETVAGLPKQAEEDKVTSSSWGWSGLTIYREYLKEDKQLTFTLANNAAFMSAVNMFLANGGYGQTTGGNQNWKQIKVKGNKAVIEYDESSGYKVSVPIGQSSLAVFEGVNFANEQEVLNAVNQFDIDLIKKTLGEK